MSDESQNTAVLKEILAVVKNIESLLERLALPMQPPVEGSSAWLLSLTEEEERAYARKKGVERRRRGRELKLREKKTAKGSDQGRK